MHFQQPIETGLYLDFDLYRQGILVEHAMRSRAIYLQIGKPGDRLSVTMNTPRMLAELYGKIVDGEWEDIWMKAIIAGLRKEGVSRTDAKRTAPLFIKHVRSTFPSAIKFDPKTDNTF